MKTIKFLILLIIASLLIACNNDVNQTASLHGTIVDNRTGTPIPAAVVKIKSMVKYDDYDYDWGHTYSAVTGTDGHYEIPNIDKSDISKYGKDAIEKYFIEVTAVGYSKHQSHIINCNRSSHGADLSGSYYRTCANELGSHGWECYTIVIDAGRSVQYDAALSFSK